MNKPTTLALSLLLVALVPWVPAQAQERQVASHGGVFVSEGTLDTYIGTYISQTGSEVRFWRQDEELMVQATGQAAWPMRAESETVFMVRELQVKVTFGTNASGETDHVVLLMDGQESKAMRRR